MEGPSSSSARIVAIETSGRRGSVAVAEGGRIIEARELTGGMRHAVELMPAIAALTRAAGWKPGQIEHVYLSIGPGSFTGLRIAVAIARALHQAIGCKLVAVPSLDVIAENAPGDAGIVLPVLDAKRGLVFAARYERAGTAETLVQRVPAALVDPAALVASAIQAAVAQGVACIAILGEGVEYHRPALLNLAESAAQSGIRLLELGQESWAGRAETVWRLGYAKAQRGDFSDPRQLVPLYIRLPEAEEVWRRKQGIAPQ